MDPTYPLIPIIHFLCAILALLPLPWLIAHWNTGAWMYSIWVSLGCIILGVNGVIWKDNTENVAPVWCDISSRLIIGINIAIPAASLAITRRIYLMFSMKQPLAGTRKEKRNAILFDLGLTLGLPILQMILYYVVQGHRFNIIEEYGCGNAIVNVPLAYVLIFSWPLAAGLISCTYCAMIVRIYLKRRRTLSKLDHTTDFGRYYRVLALGCADAVFTVPCSVLVIVLDSALSGPVVSMTWSEVHYNFSRVDHYPAIIWRNAPYWQQFVIRWNIWVMPSCAFIFFCFFGLTREVWCGYMRAFASIFRKLGLNHFSIRRKKDKLHPEEILDVSEFRVTSNQGANQSGNHDPLFTSVLTASTIGMERRGDAKGGGSVPSETDVEAKIPPLQNDDAVKPVDPRRTGSDRV